MPLSPPACVLLTGANGMLAHAIAQRAPSPLRLVALGRADLDVGNRRQVLDVVSSIAPEAIINCAAFNDVDGCEHREAHANQVNGEGPGFLAEAAAEAGATLAHVSSDYVFDGAKRSPYVETDPPHPLSAYGRSKLLGETRIRDSGLTTWFIVRTGWLYGPCGRNFVHTIMASARCQRVLRVVADRVGSPTYTGDLASALFQLIRTEAYGIYHFSGEGECSWYTLAAAIVERLRVEGVELALESLDPIDSAQRVGAAERPPYSVLSKAKYRALTGEHIVDWRDRLAEYVGRAAQEPPND